MHLCRGNRGGHWHAEGSYEDVAERLFNALEIPFYFLEFDSPRAGTFHAIAFRPEAQIGGAWLDFVKDARAGRQGGVAREAR
jgi:5-methyltetrahydropteroyltriglutamate--homocysteine methyltransferase